MRILGATGIALGTMVATASCAALSGLDDYGACTSDDCEGASRSPSSALDGSTPPATSASADASTPPDDMSAPTDDVTEGLPGEGGNPSDTGGEGPVRPPPADAQTADVVVPRMDAGPDSMAPVVDSGVGPTCGPLANHTRCNGSQVCCANLAAQTNSCTAPASCAANATLKCVTASDCPGSTPICCATLTLAPDAANDLPPKCTATTLSATCAASCIDTPPSDPTTCRYPPTGNGTVRLCSHDADCTSDTAVLGGGCYNFNGAPVAWCSTSLAGSEGTHQP